MKSLRKTLIARLAKLGVEEKPAPERDDGFAGLCYQGKAFAHFHHDEELDLHLTRSVIAREGLVHPANSVKHPKRSKTSHWIELPLKTAADLDHVTRLVTLAVANLDVLLRIAGADKTPAVGTSGSSPHGGSAQPRSPNAPFHHAKNRISSFCSSHYVNADSAIGSRLQRSDLRDSVWVNLAV